MILVENKNGSKTKPEITFEKSIKGEGNSIPELNLQGKDVENSRVNPLGQKKIIAFFEV